MKKFFYAIAALMISSTSHGLVTDKFKCSLELKDLGSHASAKDEREFFIARLPLSASPAPDVRITASQVSDRLTLDTPLARFTANLDFYYKHAVKLDSDGKSREARQILCLGLAGGYCSKTPNGGGSSVCSDAVIACLEGEDPFHPTTGWSLTSLFQGVPAFNEQSMGPVMVDLADSDKKVVGSIKLDCRFLGSFL